MGQLRDKVISHARTWIDPNNPTPIPSLDYDIVYPISVYEAIHRTMDDDSPTLDVELESIYRLIAGKQDKIEGGHPGTLMTWTSVSGQIGETEILRAIASDPSDRSYLKVPSERAVGAALDQKASVGDVYDHRTNTDIHITPEEREKWDEMTPLDMFTDHRDNDDIHITAEERVEWNGKANGEDLTNHITDFNNPHNTNAHQVGTYNRSEIDAMFENIRESFFNYCNIAYDSRTDTASIVEYDDNNWNPNYVLAYGTALPTVDDESLTYFALIPHTDYSVDESQVCDIYIKQPASAWRLVGSQEMNPGDMVIRYPDSAMYVWVQGHFIDPFSSAGGGGGTGSDSLWRPIIDADGNIHWELSTTDNPPGRTNIRGPAGETPVKGRDYFDGAPGIGIPTGGTTGDVLIKSDDEDYDTEWKNVGEILSEYIDEGGEVPGLIVNYSDIVDAPPIYQELGDDENGLVSQKAITEEFAEIRDEIGGSSGIRQDLDDHIHDYNNPHRVTAASIGAVPTATFIEHTQNFDNPHNVSAAQLGLGNVNNTSDLDKPISLETQQALDALSDRIDDIISGEGGAAVTNVTWNDNTCTMIFHYGNDEETEITIPIIETFSTLYFDEVSKELVLVLPNGDERRISIENLVTAYTGGTSNHIVVTVEGGVITAELIPGSITGDEIAESVVLRGSPKAVTQLPSDNSTNLATTKFVHDQVIDNLTSYDAARPLSANMGRILNQNKVSLEDVLAIIADTPMINVIDTLVSDDRYSALSANMGRELNLTKAPIVHTSPSSVTFGRATASLFGHTRASDVDPLMDGIPDIGTDDGYYARADHRHPTDTTRAPLIWGEDDVMEGEPKAPTPPPDSNDLRIANTEWVIGNCVDVISDEHINDAVDNALDIIFGGV